MVEENADLPRCEVPSPQVREVQMVEAFEVCFQRTWTLVENCGKGQEFFRRIASMRTS